MPKSFYKPYRSEPVDRDRLLELLDYNAETGEFTWKKSIGRARAGAKAGFCYQKEWGIRFDGKNYAAHVLAWVYAYGEAPTYRLGWHDGDRLNNAITNLFEDSDDYGTGIADMTGVYPYLDTSGATGKFVAIVYDPAERCTVTLGVFRSAKGAWMSRQGALKRIELGEPINPYKAPRKASKYGTGIQLSECGSNGVKKFVAYIYDKNAGKNVRLGTFRTTEGATIARQSAAKRIAAGFFAKQYTAAKPTLEV